MINSKVQAPLTRKDKIEGWAFGILFVVGIPALLMVTTWGAST
jgi:hypothetical protein